MNNLLPFIQAIIVFVLVFFGIALILSSIIILISSTWEWLKTGKPKDFIYYVPKLVAGWCFFFVLLGIFIYTLDLN